VPFSCRSRLEQLRGAHAKLWQVCNTHARTEKTHTDTQLHRDRTVCICVLFFGPCPIFLAVDSEFICHWPDHLPACVCAAARRSGSNYAALVRVWFVRRHGDFDLARCNDSLRRPITVRCVQHLLTTLAYNTCLHTPHASHASARRCAVPSSPCLRVTVWRAQPMHNICVTYA
jgi:hypothetical protein